MWTYKTLGYLPQSTNLGSVRFRKQVDEFLWEILHDKKILAPIQWRPLIHPSHSSSILILHLDVRNLVSLINLWTLYEYWTLTLDMRNGTPQDLTIDSSVVIWDPILPLLSCCVWSRWSARWIKFRSNSKKEVEFIQNELGWLYL